MNDLQREVCKHTQFVSDCLPCHKQEVIDMGQEIAELRAESQRYRTALEKITNLSEYEIYEPKNIAKTALLPREGE